jgi:hypothetical protein
MDVTSTVGAPANQLSPTSLKKQEGGYCTKIMKYSRCVASNNVFENPVGSKVGFKMGGGQKVVSPAPFLHIPNQTVPKTPAVAAVWSLNEIFIIDGNVNRNACGFFG